jgi:hypothetical protein
MTRHDIALDDATLLLGCLAEDDGGEAVDVAHGAGRFGGESNVPGIAQAPVAICFRMAGNSRSRASAV